MKYLMICIGLALGMLVMGGCAAGSVDVNQADEVNQVEEAKQAENLDQTDEASEATNETASTQPNEVVNGASQVEESAEIADTGPSNEVDESSETNQPEETTEVEESSQTEEVDQVVAAEMGLANVISVEARGNPGSYTFSVGIVSPDEGCQQYADWWEVLSEEGELIYRRVLLHSHATEQPFVRSGGPVEIAADQIVWVRAHMNTSGYGVVAFRGSVQSGFQEAELDPEFAHEAANLAPLPDGCDF